MWKNTIYAPFVNFKSRYRQAELHIFLYYFSHALYYSIMKRADTFPLACLTAHACRCTRDWFKRTTAEKRRLHARVSHTRARTQMVTAQIAFNAETERATSATGAVSWRTRREFNTYHYRSVILTACIMHDRRDTGFADSFSFLKALSSRPTRPRICNTFKSRNRRRVAHFSRT